MTIAKKEIPHGSGNVSLPKGSAILGVAKSDMGDGKTFVYFDPPEGVENVTYHFSFLKVGDRTSGTLVDMLKSSYSEPEFVFYSVYDHSR